MEKKFRIRAKNLAIEYESDLDSNFLLTFLREKLKNYGFIDFIIIKNNSKTFVYLKTLKQVDIKRNDFFNFESHVSSCRGIDKTYSALIYEKLNFCSKIEEQVESSNSLQYFINTFFEAKPLNNACKSIHKKHEDDSEFNDEILNQIRSKLLIQNNTGVLEKTLKASINKYSEIIKIKNTPNLTLEEKQYQLENREALFIKSFHTLAHKISPEVKKLISCIDHITATSNPLDYQDSNLIKAIQAFKACRIEKTQSTICESTVGIPAERVERFVNKVSVVRYKFLIKVAILFKIFSFENENSFGLLSLHNLSKHVLSVTFRTEDKLKEFIALNRKPGDSFQDIKDALLNNIMYSKTAVTQSIADNILQAVSNTIASLKAQFQKKHKPSFLFDLLDESVLSGVKRHIGAYYTSDQAELLDFLDTEIVKSNFSLVFSEVEKHHFASLIFTIFQELDIIGTENKNELAENHIKTRTFFFVKDACRNEILNLNADYSNLPQLVAPISWVVEKNNIFDGGYLMNSTLKKPGVRLHDVNSFALLSAGDLIAINFLQRIPYKINTKFVQYILNNLGSCIFRFLGCENVKKSTFGELRPNGVIQIYSYSDFLENSEFNLIFKNLELEHVRVLDEKTRLKIRYKLDFERDRSVKEYTRQISLIQKFLDILLTAAAFVDDIIYFSWFFDFRLRLYTSCGLLNPQAGSFARNFLDFYVDTSIEESRSDDPTYLNSQLAVWQKEAGAKSFSWLAYNAGLKTRVSLDFDVSSSGFQIYAGLTGYFDGLILTNLFFEVGKKKPTEKLDFYLFFDREFKKKLRGETMDSVYLATEFKQSAASLFKEMFDVVISSFDRAFIKDLLLCYLYSEGSKSRAAKILIKIKTNPAANEGLFIRQYLDSAASTLNPKDFYVELYRLKNNFAFRVDKVFLATFAELFPGIYKLKLFIETELAGSCVIQERKGIDLKISENELDTTLIRYHIFTHVKKKYSYISGHDRKVKHYTLLESTNIFDKSGAKSSIGPNFIHRIDSFIMSKLLQKAEKLNVPLCAVHDCIQTLPVFENIVKKLYFEAYQEVVLDNNPLIPFINANMSEIEANASIKKFNFSAEREKITRSIALNTVMPSDFILTP